MRTCLTALPGKQPGEDKLFLELRTGTILETMYHDALAKFYLQRQPGLTSATLRENLLSVPKLCLETSELAPLRDLDTRLDEEHNPT